MYMQKSYPPETSHILFSEPLCHVFHHFLVRKGRVDACILARWTHSVFCALGISYAGSPPSAIAGSNHLCFPQIIRHSTNGHCTVFHHILTRQGCVNTCVLSRWTHNIFRAQGIAYETLCCWLLGSIGCSLPSRCSEQIWYSADCNCAVFDCFSAPAESCRHLCSNPVDAQRLSRLRRFPRRLSSISDCWIEWFTPFAGIRYSTNGHRAVFHCILTRQCRVDARALARWTHSAFRAYGVSYAGALPSTVT